MGIPSCQGYILLAVLHAPVLRVSVNFCGKMRKDWVEPQLPPNSTNSVHSCLQMLLRIFSERYLTIRRIKCDVLLHQQLWRSSNPNPHRCQWLTWLGDGTAPSWTPTNSFGMEPNGRKTLHPKTPQRALVRQRSDTRTLKI